MTYQTLPRMLAGLDLFSGVPDNLLSDRRRGQEPDHPADLFNRLLERVEDSL